MECKAFTLMVNRRVRAWLEARLLDSQQGFRLLRGPGDAQFVLARLTELAGAFGRPIYALFIDFCKAFDSLDQGVLWAVLTAYGVPPSLVAILRDMYTGATVRVRANGCLSGPFEIHAGVRQGCPLSPLLFNVYADFVMRCFEQRCANNGIVGVSVEARLPSALQPLVREVLQQLYADDQALVLPSLQGAEAAGAALHHVASEWGMSINYSKTKAMIIEADGHAGAAGHSGARPATIDLPGGSVEVVGAFKYIGALAACDGSLTTALHRRISSAAHAWRQLQPVLRQYSGADLWTKALLYRAYVLPALTYSGPETWALTQEHMRMLGAVHNRYLRRLAGAPNYGPGGVTNAGVYRLTGCPSLRKHLLQRRMKYLGHVARMPDSCITKHMLFASGISGATRPPGRPHLTWMQGVRAALVDMGVRWDDWYNLALDKEAWHTAVAGVRDGP